MLAFFVGDIFSYCLSTSICYALLIANFKELNF